MTNNTFLLVAAQKVQAEFLVAFTEQMFNRHLFQSGFHRQNLIESALEFVKLFFQTGYFKRLRFAERDFAPDCQLLLIKPQIIALRRINADGARNRRLIKRSRLCRFCRFRNDNK